MTIPPKIAEWNKDYKDPYFRNLSRAEESPNLHAELTKDGRDKGFDNPKVNLDYIIASLEIIDARTYNPCEKKSFTASSEDEEKRVAVFNEFLKKLYPS